MLGAQVRGAKLKSFVKKSLDNPFRNISLPYRNISYLSPISQIITRESAKEPIQVCEI